MEMESNSSVFDPSSNRPYNFQRYRDNDCTHLMFVQSSAIHFLRLISYFRLNPENKKVYLFISTLTDVKYF